VLVLDASRTLAFCLDDERDAECELTFARVGVDGAVAPAIWPLEVANGLKTAIRRGRIATRDLPRLRALLEGLGVEIDERPASAVFSETLGLALEHDLTTYDAAYLELAIRRGLPLATADERLRAACRTTGVELIG